MFADKHSLIEQNCQDYCALLNIFPEEIWLQILNNISSVTDQQNIFKAALLFQKLLQRKKVLLLFPKVWSILESGYFPKAKENPEPNTSRIYINNGSSRYMMFGDEVNFPALSLLYGGIKVEPPKLNNVNLRNKLNLRLVCKAWKAGIDKVLETAQLEKIRYGELKSDAFVQYSFAAYSIGGFVSFFERTHSNRPPTDYANPFMSRVVNFDFPSTYGESYELQVEKLLVKYGRHIHGCTFASFEQFVSQTQWKWAQKWLTLMPNLKALQINFYEFTSMSDKVARLATDVVSYPLPKLKKLKCLHAQRLLYPMFNHFIRTSDQLTCINLMEIHSHDDYDLFSFPLPNLTHLMLTCFSEKEFNDLQNVQFSKKFSKLRLKFVNFAPSPEKIFTVLGNQWGETLTRFSLEIPMFSRDEDESRFKELQENCKKLQKSYLPRVKWFELDVHIQVNVKFLHN